MVQLNFPLEETAMANKKGGKQFWKQQADQIAGPPPDAPYWRKTCDFCGGRAIYRFGKKVACRACQGHLRADLEKAAQMWAAKYGEYNSRRAKNV
tara:strand:+ start:637 stop:921 length:285 start_codon:yes stop_codon:yes gene_type:complete